jgi:hypothetical protein
MEDQGDIQMRMAFAKLKQYGDELALSTDLDRRSTLRALISEAETSLAQLRLETYRPLLGSRR